jgi:hypothetical protein
LQVRESRRKAIRKDRSRENHTDDYARDVEPMRYRPHTRLGGKRATVDIGEKSSLFGLTSSRQIRLS